MRKLPSGFVALALGVIVSGCGSTAATSSPSSPSSTSGFTLSGRVTEAPPGFSNLADARVEIVAGANLHSTAKSDGSGAFTFGMVPAGSYTLNVTREGYLDAKKTVSVNRNLSVDLLLYPIPPAGATARCKDKSWSYSTDKDAACLPRNGGIAYVVCPGPLCPSGGSGGS